MMESWEGWLGALRVGDVVIVSRGGGLTARRVTHATRTMVMIGARKYRRVDGCEVGGSIWHRESIAEATSERLASVRENGRRARLIEIIRDCAEGITRTTLSTDALDSIVAALAPRLAEKHPQPAAIPTSTTGAPSE